MSTATTVVNGFTPSDPTLRPHVTDRYTDLKYVGHGGMGVVYRAHDRLTDDWVALKRITVRSQADLSTTAEIARNAWEADHDHRLALTREFRTLATLRHPNIISVLDYGFALDFEPFFTMELVDNPESVLDAARRRSPRERIELLVHILRALAYLHRRGVIHRDLKPSNVLVADRVRVVDFGIAIQRGEGLRSSGTVRYMAPEVIDGEPATEASDLYAVGVIACELLSGRHPFEGFVDDALRTAILTRAPDLCGIERASERAAITCLLARDPCNRFPTADAAIDELIRAAQLPTPRHTRATRESFLSAASFVDRVEEQRLLLGAVADLKATKRGGTWMIEGTSGIGKTRLLDEIRTHALVAGAKVVRGQADSDARGTFDLWREPLRSLLLGIRLEASDAGPLLSIVPGVATLIRAEVAPTEADPKTARAQMLRSIARVLECQTGPVVLMLEDLHLAPEGVDVLRELAPALLELPVLVIGTFRGEEAPGLAQTIPGARHLRLAPLTRPDIAKLATAMLGDANDKVVDYLDRHTEGNVFFIVEAMRVLGEEAGSLDLIGAGPLPERLVSAGIADVVARRLAKLPVACRDVLAFAAIAGRVLDRPVIASRFGMAMVGDAVSLGTDVAVLDVAEDQVRFAHDKFREHLLDALAPADRRELHRAVAEAIVSVHRTTKQTAAVLAHHYRAAQLPALEAPCAALGGQAAIERGAYGEATRLLERALALYETLPAVDPKQLLEALLSYAAVLIATRSWSDPEVMRVYDRIIELATALDTKHALIVGLHHGAIDSQFRGDFATARELGLRYGKIADDSGDVAGQLEAQLTLANVATWLGNHRDAERLHRQILALYDPAEVAIHMKRFIWNPWIVARVTHAVSSCICGETELAVAIAHEAIDLAKQTNHPWMLAISYQIAVWVHQLRGDVAETLDYAVRLDEASRADFKAYKHLADVCSGWAMVHGGDTEAGLQRMRDAIAGWHAMGARIATTFYATQLADACLLAGRDDEAERVLTAALDENERCYHAELHRLLAEVHRRRGDLARADRELTQAIELARAQGARLFEDRALKSRVMG